MSKTIDERVVEMRFDNKQFESNVNALISLFPALTAALAILAKDVTPTTSKAENLALTVSIPF